MEKQLDAEEVLAIESDVESNTGLVFDEPAKEIPKQSAGSGQKLQSPSADTSATPFSTGVQVPMEVKDEEMEAEAVLRECAYACE